jgi:hypothetical protein
MARDDENNSQKAKDSFAMKGKNSEHTIQLPRQGVEVIK